MSTQAIVSRAFDVFQADVRSPPPLTLRGGNAVDSYDQPRPFDPIQDEPTDAYFEGFAFWGLGYLDARSWRHYLPRLIDYAFRHPNDPAMVSEALMRSLRPPDRYPPRLATLTTDQESVVREFLERVALHGAVPHLQADAQQALEEWWLPDARCRPTALEIAALRAGPVVLRVVEGDVYRLSLPETFTGSGVRVIPEESRRVQTWGGYLCGDAPTSVAVNVTPLAMLLLTDAVRTRSQLFRDTVSPRPDAVPGSPRAERLEGLTHGDGPTEPQTLVMIFATTLNEVARSPSPLPFDSEPTGARIFRICCRSARWCNPVRRAGCHYKGRREESRGCARPGATSGRRRSGYAIEGAILLTNAGLGETSYSHLEPNRVLHTIDVGRYHAGRVLQGRCL